MLEWVVKIEIIVPGAAALVLFIVGAGADDFVFKLAVATYTLLVVFYSASLLIFLVLPLFKTMIMISTLAAHDKKSRNFQRERSKGHSRIYASSYGCILAMLSSTASLCLTSASVMGLLNVGVLNLSTVFAMNSVCCDLAMVLISGLGPTVIQQIKGSAKKSGRFVRQLTIIAGVSGRVPSSRKPPTNVGILGRLNLEMAAKHSSGISFHSESCCSSSDGVHNGTPEGVHQLARVNSTPETAESPVSSAGKSINASLVALDLAVPASSGRMYEDGGGSGRRNTDIVVAQMSLVDPKLRPPKSMLHRSTVNVIKTSESRSPLLLPSTDVKVSEVTAFDLV